jgi:hypothetical protein
VSLKTARRDSAALKTANLICYVRSRRKGRYRKTIGAPVHGGGSRHG